MVHLAGVSFSKKIIYVPQNLMSFGFHRWKISTWRDTQVFFFTSIFFFYSQFYIFQSLLRKICSSAQSSLVTNTEYRSTLTLIRHIVFCWLTEIRPQSESTDGFLHKNLGRVLSFFRPQFTPLRRGWLNKGARKIQKSEGE